MHPLLDSYFKIIKRFIPEDKAPDAQGLAAIIEKIRLHWKDSKYPLALDIIEASLTQERLPGRLINNVDKLISLADPEIFFIF